MTLLIDESVRLFANSEYCDSKCTEIVDYVVDYHDESRKTEDFILAVINLQDFIDFDDFMMKAVGKQCRRDYRRALKEGYYVKVMSVEEQNNRRDELYAINASAEIRQGNKMSEEYFVYPDAVVPFECPLHFHKTYGVFSKEHTWVGYIYTRYCGEVASILKILGHLKYMGTISFMMVLLFGIIKDIMEQHPVVKYFEYHLIDAGTQGLQNWKHNTGFRPVRFTGVTI